MNSLYITSVEQFSGKTATCLALGRRFQAEGLRVGYLKPVSLQPFRIGERVADEDATFVKKVLGLKPDPWDLSPVVISHDFLQAHLGEDAAPDLMDQVRAAYETISSGQDVMLLEGGSTLRDGYSVGLPTPGVAEALHSRVMVIVCYHDEVRLLDDVLASKARIGDALLGILVNRVSPEGREFITATATPHLQKIGVPIFGVLPETSALSALTVGELVDTLQAEILTRYHNMADLVETFTIGAMTQEAALSRFRKQPHKAVITGGDRADILLAALETSTACLILTGNLRPSPLVIRQAEEFGVSVLLVHANTMETIERIEAVYGKSRLGQEEKLHQFEDLMEKHFDYAGLYNRIGMSY